MFNPSGQTMMQPGSMYNGSMGMMQPVKFTFHVPADSLIARGLTMSQLVCRYMDSNGNWNNITGQINNTDNTITISSSQLYSFYAVVPSSATAVDNKDNSLPGKYALQQNYPNPFNPSTVIRYSLPAESRVSIKVYDLIGKEVSELVNNVEAAGVHEVNFNASNLPSGIYFYSLNAGNFSQTKKMMLLK